MNSTDNSNAELYGEHLRCLRTTAGLSQAQIANY